MKLLIIIATLGLMSCDKEVSRTYSKKVKSVQSITCSYQKVGYCMDCGFDFSGNWSCTSMRFKPSCSYYGHQKAEVENFYVYILRESGKIDTIGKTEVLNKLTKCAP